MDNVTQRNAGNSEESAATLEKMNSQALQMTSVVNELIALIGDSEDLKKQIRNIHSELTDDTADDSGKRQSKLPDSHYKRIGQRKMISLSEKDVEI